MRLRSRCYAAEVTSSRLWWQAGVFWAGAAAQLFRVVRWSWPTVQPRAGVFVTLSIPGRVVAQSP